MPAPQTVLPENARRAAAWCGVVLLVVGVAAVVVWLVVVLKTAVTPVLLALLGTALLGPVHRWLIARRLNRSLAAGLTCAALVAVVGGAGYIVVTALIDSGDQIVASLKDAGQWIVDHLEIGGTTDVDDLADNAKSLVVKFGAAGGRSARGISVIGSLGGRRAGPAAELLLPARVRPGRAAGRPGAPRGRGTWARRWGGGRRGRRGLHAQHTFIDLIDAVCITVGLLVLDVPGAVGLGALVFVGAYPVPRGGSRVRWPCWWAAGRR
ncbi:AI-2E family transporter [Streptomyces californicus]